MPKFSIVMPCYNLEERINKTIEFVLKQSFVDFELIIIDDGSTDSTREIIKKYEQIDNRIRACFKKNGGVSSARNLGIKKSLGEYILFLDGDDFITDDLLEKANDVFLEKNPDMFAYGYRKTSEDLNKLIKSYSYKRHDKKMIYGKDFQNLHFSRRIAQCMCSFIIKKSVISENYILFDEQTKYAEDQEFQARCNISSKYIYYDSREYFYYIQREGSAMNQKVIRDNFDVYFRIGTYINNDSRKHYNNFLCYVFIANLKEIVIRGSERETVIKLLSIDYVLKDFKFESTKHGLLTKLFIFYYKFLYKNLIKKKYEIHTSEC